MSDTLSQRWSMRASAFSIAEQQLAQRLSPLLPLLADAPSAPRVIAIDGRCGSGKTTLAQLLSSLLNAPCVHMDDFHLPYRLKTPERLAQPGGNSDRERVIREVLQPWKYGETVVYRPYDCAVDALSAPVTLSPGTILILEGSYAHHPALSAYTDMQLFVQVEQEEQFRRLRQRCPEKFPMFLSRWIPLEEAYFSACSLPSPQAIVIHNDSVQGL